MGNAVTNPGRFVEKKVFNVPREKSVFVDHSKEEAARARQRAREQAERERRDAERRGREAAERNRREQAALEAERRRRREQEAAHRAQIEAQRRQQAEEQRIAAEARRHQQIQSLRDQFNTYQSHIDAIERQLSAMEEQKTREEIIEVDLRRQIDAESNALSKFAQERADLNLARFVLIGETGNGKSTLANRLIGDTSQYCDAESAIFRVSHGVRSQKSAIQKETRSVRLPNGATKTIAVIDTPGLSDSDGRDRHHANMLCEYLRGVERVHAFVIVLSIANPRLDDGSVQGLREMTNMFGRNFWKFVTIAYTNVDDDRQRANLEKNSLCLQETIRMEFGLEQHEAPLMVVGIGFDDWERGVMELIQGANVAQFHTCDRLESPLENLEACLRRQIPKTQAVRDEVTALNSRVEQVRANLEATRKSLQGFGVYV